MLAMAILIIYGYWLNITHSYVSTSSQSLVYSISIFIDYVLVVLPTKEEDFQA